MLQGNPAAAAAAQAQRLSVAYNNLGGILKMQGRAAEAISCYEHVALLQPNSPEVKPLTAQQHRPQQHGSPAAFMPLFCSCYATSGDECAGQPAVSG
jgi:hypothetical protein